MIVDGRRWVIRHWFFVRAKDFSPLRLLGRLIDGRRRVIRRPEGPQDDSPGQRPGFGWCEKNPASCKPPPDLPSAGRGVDCRMRGMGRASHPQDAAPPLASLYPGLSSGGPSGRIGYTFVNHFRLSIMIVDGRRQAIRHWIFVGAKDFSHLRLSGRPIVTRRRCLLFEES